MNLYFTLVDPTRERFPTTPAVSRPSSPVASRPPSLAADSRRPSLTRAPTDSRPSSPVRESAASTIRETGANASHIPLEARVDSLESAMDHIGPPPASPFGVSPISRTSSTAPATPSLHERRGRRALRHPHFEPESPTSRAGSVRTRHSRGHSFAHALHLPHLHGHREHVVGVFESQRYLDLESLHFTHPLGARYTARATELLRESVEELLGACVGALGSLDGWLESSRRHGRAFWRGGEKARRIREERIAKLEAAIGELRNTRERFKRDRRYVVCLFCASVRLMKGADCASLNRTGMHSTTRSTSVALRAVTTTCRRIATSSIAMCTSTISVGSRPGYLKRWAGRYIRTLRY
jgi:hypothetical protein